MNTITVSAHGPAPMHEVRFADSAHATEAFGPDIMVALIHVAVCTLNVDCDEPGSCVAVAINGTLVRRIEGPDLVELGRRVQAGIVAVIGGWWEETKHKDLA